jgi:hypothetical protein
LKVLREQENLRILRIEYRSIPDIRQFVLDLYACDTVPIEHLNAKIEYLFETRPEIIIVFAENLAPEEHPTGYGEFRKVQCQFINRIKIKIRNRFNPRHSNKEFQIPPLDKGVSHEHVIHASDYEEQVDYTLKLLGYTQGIAFFDNDALPFEKPYHVERPRNYVLKSVPIRSLKASIISDVGKEGACFELLDISQTPHFKLLFHGTDEYRRYLDQFHYSLLMDDHCCENLLKMKTLAESEVRAFKRILVERIQSGYRIVDGVHRAAVSLYHGINVVRCVEFVS